MNATYTWIDGTVSKINTMTPEELTRYRAEVTARLSLPQTEPQWDECEMCGCGVAPQAKVYGMPIHGNCWLRLTQTGRETIAHRHCVSYDARTEEE